MRRERRSTGKFILGSASALAVFYASITIPLMERIPAAENSKSQLPISAPVKVLSSDDSQPEQTRQNEMRNQEQPQQPTLPGGKLPQYQLGYRQRVLPSEAEIQNPNLRFLLALPEQPILVEAAIMIDGQPFRKVRENRIQEILKNATQPKPIPEAESVSERSKGDEPPSDLSKDNDDTVSTSGEEKTDGEDGETEEEKPEEKPVPQPTVAPYSQPTTATERLRRYIAATGKAPIPEEVRWFLTNREKGPTLLMLNDNFQRFRADQRPVFDVLDRNRDGTVSADEIKLAVQSFNECDFNRNKIVEYTEIGQAANDSRRQKAVPADPGKLIFLISETGLSPLAYERLASRYVSSDKNQSDSAPKTHTLPRFDKNSNGQFDTKELQSLRETDPDVKLRITFSTTEPGESEIAVTQVTSPFEKSLSNATARTSTIILPLGKNIVEFSALQEGASDQVSLGAVDDGYPMLPSIDPNDDGRFTIREMRGLVDNLREFDGNRDGRLTSDEAQAPIRVCFGLGPLVHSELASIRSRHSQSDEPKVTGPEWFVRMDRNKDNDLTRNEFPGTDEQFDTLDADDDELIGAKEAVDFDKQFQSPEETSPSEPESSEDSLEEME